MSTLWTPSGEHAVPRSPAGGSPSGSPAGHQPSPAPPAGAGPTGDRRATGNDGHAPGPSGESGQGRLAQAGEPSAEEIRAAEEEMAAVREELLRAPAELVVANHAMGLWELAALHLSSDPPQLPQAQLAIDALSGLLDGTHGKLGDAEKTLADGLAQIRMAFVQLAQANNNN